MTRPDGRSAFVPEAFLTGRCVRGRVTCISRSGMRHGMLLRATAFGVMRLFMCRRCVSCGDYDQAINKVSNQVLTQIAPRRRLSHGLDGKANVGAARKQDLGPTRNAISEPREAP
jgi:hypothetical protein